ncbi:uncharacterized protein V1513DRAFT_450835 [Lipomyces chichibuensis]|uniref:uncharacterized protein n=1 Tax=Lipomyces chichibuensis TaxID=1546026 RepID=UPI003343F694
MDYSKLKVVELKEELKNRGLSTAGLKKDLVQRLSEADAVSAVESNEPTEEQTKVTEQAVVGAPTADTGEVEPPRPAPESAKGEQVSVQITDSEPEATVAKAADLDKVSELELKPEPEEPEEPAKDEEVPEERLLTDQSAPANETAEQPAEAEIKQDSITTGESREGLESSTVAKRKASFDAETEDSSLKRIKNESRYDQRMAEQTPEPSGTAEVTKEKIKVDEKLVTVDRNPNTPMEKYRPTKSVYLQNFSRPLNIPSLKTHLETLAGSKLVKFWIDSIRTHCYAIFESVEAATKVREDIYGQTFPLEEKGRKKLIAEYIPDSKVGEWIAFEEGDQGRLRKWEVAFGDGLSNGVDADEIKLIEAGTKPTNIGPSFRDRLNPRHSPWVDTTRGIADTSNMANVKVKTLSELFKKTNAKPSLYYCEAPEDVVRERLRKLQQ